MIRAFIAVLFVLSSCSRSSGGPLEPAEAPGVELSKDADGRHTATIRSGAVSAKVSARWSNTGGQSVMVIYSNTGSKPVHIEFGALAMTGPAGEAVLMSAADVTETNLLDDRTDNDDARGLVERDGDGVAKGSIELSPGMQRRIDIQLSPFSNSIAAEDGNAITLHLPVPAGSKDVAFVARRPSISPF